MKKRILILLLIITTIFVLYLLSFYLQKKRYDEQMKKQMDIVVFFNDDIKLLNNIEFSVCDSIYKYSRKDILDTIYERIAISDRKFPCAVGVNYHFIDGTTKQIKVDSFNCAGCSGTNIYILFDDKVKYVYHP